MLWCVRRRVCKRKSILSHDFFSLLGRQGILCTCQSIPPTANGVLERENRNILSALRKLLQDPNAEWDVALYAVVAANNATAKRAHSWQRSPLSLCSRDKQTSPLTKSIPPRPWTNCRILKLKSWWKFAEKKCWVSKKLFYTRQKNLLKSNRYEFSFLFLICVEKASRLSR